MLTPRVVHVIPALFGYEGVFGGAERYAYELARAMSDRVPTRLVAFGATPITRRDGNLRVEVVRNLIPYRRFVFDPLGPGLLPHLAWADVIHYHQTHTMMASVALVAGRLTGRRVFTSHLGGAGQGLHKFMDVAPWYHGYLHISEYSRRIFGHDTLPTAAVIYGGVDTERLSPPSDHSQRRHVLFAGRLLPHKGIDYLIEGIPPEIPLVVAGRRWRHASGYHALLRELAKGKNVRFIEDATDDDLRELFRGARCVVLPSVHRDRNGGTHPIPELLGLTLLEGMSCGAPAIGTAVASLPEVVENGLTGMVVPPNDPSALREAILTLWNDRETAGGMGDAARRRVLDRFTWPAVAERCLNLYAKSP